MIPVFTERKTEAQKMSVVHSQAVLFPEVIHSECGHWTGQVCAELMPGEEEARVRCDGGRPALLPLLLLALHARVILQDAQRAIACLQQLLHVFTHVCVCDYFSLGLVQSCVSRVFCSQQ